MEDPSQSECCIGMPIFDHYTNGNDVDPLFFKVESYSSATASPPLDSFNPSSPLAHYSLKPYLFDKFVALEAPLNYFSPYPTNCGCNKVQHGVLLQSKDEKFESIIHDLFNCKYFISQEEDIPTLNDQRIFSN